MRSKSFPIIILTAFSVLVGAVLFFVSQVYAQANKPNPLPPATQGKLYSHTLAQSGGKPPHHWSVIGGRLPPGLTLSPAGVLSGIPTASGNFSFIARVSDSTIGRPLTTNTDFTLTIAAPTQAVVPPPGVMPPHLVVPQPRVGAIPPVITTASPLPPASQGKSYNDALTASGGKAPYQWSVFGGKLPTGVTLLPTGVLSGTPTASGNFSFTVALTDSTAGVPLKTTKPFALTVGPTAATSTKNISIATPLTAAGFAAVKVVPKTIAVATPLSAAGFAAVPIVPKTIAVATPLSAAGFAAVPIVPKTIAVVKPLTATGF